MADEGVKPACVVQHRKLYEVLQRLATLDVRVKEQDVEIGAIMRAASQARDAAAAAHEISKRVLNEFLQIRDDISTGFERQAMECEIRHNPMARHLEYCDEHTHEREAAMLTMGSGVNYSHEALAAKYNILRQDLEAMKVQRMKSEAAAKLESEQRHAAEVGKIVAQATARKMLIAAVAGGVATILAAAAALVQAWGR